MASTQQAPGRVLLAWALSSDTGLLWPLVQPRLPCALPLTSSAPLPALLAMATALPGPHHAGRDNTEESGRPHLGSCWAGKAEEGRRTLAAEQRAPRSPDASLFLVNTS